MNPLYRTLTAAVVGGVFLQAGHAALTTGLAYSAFNIPNPDTTSLWRTTNPTGAVPNSSTAWTNVSSVQGAYISDGGNDNIQTGAATVWNSVGATSQQTGAALYVTQLYRGWFYDADGFISFAENIDDNVQVSVDGVVVLLNNQGTQDGAWQAVSTSTSDQPAQGGTTLGNTAWGGLNALQQAGNLGPGWHSIEIRLGEFAGTGGPHASAVAPAANWTPTFGFGVAGLGGNLLPTGAGQYDALNYVQFDAANFGTAPDGGPALRYDNSDPTGLTNIIIPEPASLGLLLGAIGLGALGRRRRA